MKISGCGDNIFELEASTTGISSTTIHSKVLCHLQFFHNASTGSLETERTPEEGYDSMEQLMQKKAQASIRSKAGGFQVTE